VNVRKRRVLFCLALICAGARAQNAPVAVTPEQIKQGSEIYATNCATCHGNRMKNPEWAIDLATIPKDDRQRFVQSVTNGKNNMPPWGDVLKPEDIAALWAYFSQGEK
jgi:mono/diheme cytochrome c family protein